MKSRKETNIRILIQLMKLVELYPDLRFNQLLITSGFTVNNSFIESPINELMFYEESDDTLARVLKTIYESDKNETT